MGQTVAVTGAAGWIGSRVVATLDRDPSVSRILAVDTRPVPYRSPKLTFRAFDVRDPELAEVLADADVLVHLAFAVNPMRDVALMHAINVGGFRNVLDAAAAAGVGRIVYPSSVYAYGAHPDNAVPLAEGDPLRPNAGFPYAEHKAETEAILADWSARHPEVSVSVLRLAVTVGPFADNFMTRLFESPVLLGIDEGRPPLQVLHEADAASAIVFFATADAPGTFNIAADDAVPRDDVVALLGRPEVRLPADVVFPAADLAWKVGLADAPAAELNALLYPCTMATEHAHELGWKAEHSSLEAIRETVEAHRAFVTVGPWRLPEDRFRKIVRYAALSAAASALVTAAGSAGVVWMLRQRR